MKQAAILAALLLSLPFLECICSNTEHLNMSCQNCSDYSHLPNTSHDCLELVEFFALQEIFLQSFYASIFKFSKINEAAKPNSFQNSIEFEHPCWFGKLKPHIALNIIQV